MNLQEAITILEKHLEWRKLEPLGLIPNAREITEAIGVVLGDKKEDLLIEFLKWYRDAYEDIPYGVSYDFIIDEFFKNRYK